MILSKRLRVIADLIEENSSILDVGCDHGLLDIFLFKTKKNMKIIGSDISEHSIASAMENASKFGVSNKIRFVQADGIKAFKGKYDYLIMSGLGGYSMIKILGENDIINFKNIILQANTDHYELRKFMNSIGYKIIYENNTYDKDKYYITIHFVKGEQKLNKKQLDYGPYLLKKKDEIFLKKLRIDLEKFIKISKKIPKYKILKYWKINLKIKEIKEILKKD